MSSEPLPGYAGIADVQRLGWPVEHCASLVSRFAAIKRQSLLVLASRLSSTPEWEVKAGMGRWLYEDAVRYRELETRLRELRGSASMIQKVLEYALGDYFSELLGAPGTVELLAGIFDLLGPALLEAIDAYCAGTQPLVDFPTVALLRHWRFDEMERQKLGQALLDGLSKDAGAGARRTDWAGHFSSFLLRAGGILGDKPAQPGVAVRPRAPAEFRIPEDFARDRRFHTTLPKIPPQEFAGNELLTMMWGRSQEMTAAEMLATVIHEWEDLPTDGLVDLARHCWDEVRHSLFGQAALEHCGFKLWDLPSWVGYARHTLPFSPQKRYSHLAIASEAKFMAYPGGKRGEWEFCRDEAKDPLITTFQDFDWADEVTHVNFGRKWLIEYFLKGDRAAARKMADETVAERAAYYAQFEDPGRPNRPFRAEK